MRIPEPIVEQIRVLAEQSIVEIIGDYVTLKKKGANYWGLSPFKQEKTPSFAVSPQKGIFKDFSTGKGGTAITFLMEIEGLSYPEALILLAKRFHLPIEIETGENNYSQQEKRKDSLLILNEFAGRYFQKQLWENPEAKSAIDYLLQRGFTEKTLQQFQIGYATDAWDNFTTTAIRQQFQEDLLKESGLSILSEKTGKLYD
ncbi:MAG: CHC2 zinc finger domain-containing protein, partial [Bacteroidia bacterium]|nr:CHC2 zinc finger domain-containing protein [Bacteroidia bacterium]